MNTLDAQIEKLLAACFSLVESNRTLSATVAVVSSQLGRLGDDMREFAEKTNTRQSDSESSIRLLKTDSADAQRRLAKIEDALGFAEPVAAYRPGPR